MPYWLIAVIFAVGVILAFPLAILLTVAVGWPLLKLAQFLNPCPKCGARKLRWVNGLRCPHPPSFYECDGCGVKLKWQSAKWSEATNEEIRFFKV